MFKHYQSRFLIFVVLLMVVAVAPAAAQKNARQPKADKVINDYLKAIGGKKKTARIKNTVYEWDYSAPTASGSAVVGRAQTRTLQSPTAWRRDIKVAPTFELEQIRFDEGNADTTATNGTSAWRREQLGTLRTLTDAESKALRLQAALLGTRLTDLKTPRVGAIVTGTETVGGETAYVVEFAARNGAKWLFSFGASSKLLLRTANNALNASSCLRDYKTVDGVLEPHTIVEPCDNDAGAAAAASQVVYTLRKASFNTNVNSAVFDPPRTIENFDIAALLKELQQNEQELQQRVSEYSFAQTTTLREFDGKGQIKKQELRAYEVFPTKTGRAVRKLISENGVQLTGEKLTKEEQRAGKELEEAEADYEKEQRKREARRAENAQRLKEGKEGKPDEADLERNAILNFLRTSELYSPRIEQFRDREVIVVNFRPRPDFKPKNLVENVFSKLAGTMWVDQTDKQIIRAETTIIENVKVGGGLLFNFRPGSAIVFERTKFGDVWLPKLFQANASAKILFFSGFDAAFDNEYSDYRRFTTEAKDYTIGSPNDESKSNENKHP